MVTELRKVQTSDLGWKFSFKALRLFGLASMALISAIALGDDIPFDVNVPDQNAAPAPAAPTQKAPAANPAPTNNAPAAAPPAATSEDFNNLDKIDNLQPAPVTAATPAPAMSNIQTGPRRVKAPAELSGLGNLAPFNDIAVISRRFLPKTGRFEVFPNFGMILNDAFFTDFVIGARLGWYFSENYGVEASFLAVSTSDKGLTDELKQQRTILTNSLATPTGFYGLDFKWAPIYGKLGLMNKKIVPFDMYFSLGGGITPTNQSTSPATLHLGVGQIFAIKKWMAGRWDLSWYGYNTSYTNFVNGAPTGIASGTFSNLHLTLGVSFFFPEAEYR